MTQIEKVVTWVNSANKPLWWRQVVRMVMGQGGLQQQDLQLIYQVVKMEFGLLPRTPEFPNYVKHVAVAGFEAEAAPVTLASLGNVKNVSSLIENVTLNFPIEGLTAVYGDNGAGKSSYAKILKSACLTRGDIPVISTNAFNPSAVPSQATLGISVDGAPIVENIWTVGGEPNPELKSIRIFDSHSATNYISKTDSVEYKPAEVKLLDELSRACQFVKGALTLEVVPFNRPYIIPDLNPHSKVSTFCNSLATASEATLYAHCGGENELPEIAQLEKDLAELNGKTPAQLKAFYATKLKHREPLLNFLNNLYEKLNDVNVTQIGVLYDDKLTKLKVAENVRQNTLNGLPIKGIGNDAWKEMWNHAQNFIMGNGDDKTFPPVKNEHCPTCLQPIGSQAAERMARFNDYITNQSQVDADKATAALILQVNLITQLSFDLKPYEGIFEEIRQSAPDAIEQFNICIQQLFDRKNNLSSANPTFTHPALDMRFLQRLSKQVETLKVRRDGVADDGTLAQMIKLSQVRLMELEDRQRLSAHKDNILIEINRIKIFGCFNSALATTNLSLITRFISELAKTGSLGVINAAFTKELVALNFKSFDVETKTQGSAGQQKLTLQISRNASKIGHIASEGEQKCIALAGFMAELTIDNRKSAIIFDDPVNSLDHKWRRKFAKRIADEALHRQVIVLTHDLPFLMMLSEESSNPINIQSITRRGNFSGFPQGSPPWDALKTLDRIGQLKQLEVELRRYTKRDDFIEDMYSRDAKHIYGKMRETWERLVEEWLIRNVVQRFSRVVQTLNIRYIVDSTPEDVATISAGMGKCSTYFEGHDTATGLGVTQMPDIDELLADITALDVYFKELKKRRS
ncbi:AAA family ATPase [Pseudoalteromonas sp. SWN29]|uniref:AAA family ATPase n=1 Tax=Pseudoalteromonas sp. SWN29 TaxID=2792064 RepID=UPI0018CF451E|nr:AAA family ATPase [Pseudoalteromonas sp. SWN29]MBH0025942.1 AAA family ATPase [Pseudoalteromonas sp. SWN29]